MQINLVRVSDVLWVNYFKSRAQTGLVQSKDLGKTTEKKSAALKVPKSILASIILKWKTTRTHPSTGTLAKLSRSGRRALVRGVTRSPATLTEL